MGTSGDTRTKGAQEAEPVAAGGRARRVSYLDRAVWNRLGEATSPAEVAAFWLPLQCRLVDDVVLGTILLPGDGTAAFQPAAFWPEAGNDRPADLFAAAERAIAERRGVIVGHRPDAATRGTCFVAYPFVGGGAIDGAVALAIADRPEAKLREVMRELQWGAAWIELARRRGHEAATRRRLERIGSTLDIAAVALEHADLKSSTQAVATELARRLECPLVAVGLAASGHSRVVAISHSASFGGRMNLTRRLAAAMDEAVDQESLVLYPPADDDVRITHAHGELANQLDDATILTVPLVSDSLCVGAICLQRPPGGRFEAAEIELCDTIAAILGPLLEEKRRNDRLVLLKLRDSLATQIGRLVGPGHVGRKLAALGLGAAIAFFAVAEGTHRVTAPARIEGLVQRVLVAPFDGYVAAQSARAGDRVRQGMVLASLDDRDLALEKLRWTTTRQQRLAEHDQALARRERAAINIIAAQIEQAEAQIALIGEQLARLQLVAPFDGIVVSGDLSQSIGAAVRRGDELLRIAPLDAYRVILAIDEVDMAHVVVGQKGHLKITSLIDAVLPYTIAGITPVTEVRDGRNVFRVEATLDVLDPGLRPGMEGVAKTDIGPRLLVRNWTDEALSWLRLKLWAWWP
ncbi:MAG: HlyD family efflux transporter periplasmic adaptor subunit [Alphaproteobacteria bacterium]|nr:HlyD family efflux transporter periplasmic adaptor subunit [Alphaproteobacteria bacterium]